MATTADVVLQIAGLGAVFEAPVDTEPVDMATLRFGDEETYGSWNWIGDTSAENMIEFSVDGGESDSKRTWERLDMRASSTPEKLGATINSVNLHNETFKLAFPNAYANTAKGRIDVGDSGGSSERALMIVIRDADAGTQSALWLPHVSIKGSFPKLSLEEFTEIPLSVNVLSSLTHTLPTGGFVKWSFVEAKKLTATESPAA